MEDILRIGVTAIRDWVLERKENDDDDNAAGQEEGDKASSSLSSSSAAHNSLNTITLYGFAEQETNILLAICEEELSN